MFIMVLWFVGPPIPHPTPSGDFAIGPEQLASVTRDHNFNALQEYGGVDLWKLNLLIDIDIFVLFCHLF